MHAAVDMAKYHTPGRLPLELVWPYDCEMRCGQLVKVERGPLVADEMTRNLREPFKTAMRKDF